MVIHCVTQVLREHQDFAVFNEPADIANTAPDFKFVRKKMATRFVLVLDVSGSMVNEQRIDKMGQVRVHGVFYVHITASLALTYIMN